VLPVEGVNWEAMREVCVRLGLQIPTEAQWEYGARGGTTTVWSTGSVKSSLVGFANLADQAAARVKNNWPDIKDWPELDDGFAETSPVYHYEPNPFGLFNVHGNVGEACADPYEARSSELDASHLERARPGQIRHDRVARGGGYSFAAVLARSANRSDITPENASSVLGLRPARTISRP
jgi:formylglycine-generating enzyme required for sulfatase activity